MPDTDPLSTPMKRPGFRDPEYVQSIVLRMGTGYVDALDKLCEVNDRSRRQIVEILVAEKFADFIIDADNRITPL